MNEKAPEDLEPEKAWWKKWWGPVVLAVVGLYLGLPLAVRVLFGDLTASGQVGDTFGVVNALFSGAALLGAIYAIFLQGKELALQREEMKLQREEMLLQREETHAVAKATAQQVASMERQAKLQAAIALFTQESELHRAFGDIAAQRAAEKAKHNDRSSEHGNIEKEEGKYLGLSSAALERATRFEKILLLAVEELPDPERQRPPPGEVEEGP